jgi:hypothetical protein
MRLTPRRWLALGLVGLVALGVGWVLAGAWAGPSDDPTVTLRCLGVRCGGEVLACVRDPECKAWLDCMQGCGADKMRCPTFCGAFFQSKRVSAFTQCGLTNQCIQVEFEGLPACAAPAAPLTPLEGADGVWWVAAIRGHDYVLFDDCQRFVFETLGPTEVRARNSMPLTHQGETRICRNEGKYTRTASGMMQLVYENWNGYFEEWHYSWRSENALLAHVCSSGAPGRSHDYGTFILTRRPLADLPQEERARVEQALRDIYRLEVSDLRALKTTGCANDEPLSPTAPASPPSQR